MLLNEKWGWMVTAASFMAALLTDGVTFCFGLILFEIVRFFDEPVEKVAWIHSSLMGIQLLAGDSHSRPVYTYTAYIIAASVVLPYQLQ